MRASVRRRDVTADCVLVFIAEPRIAFREDELIHAAALDAFGGLIEIKRGGGARLCAALC
jgi:hypothetical protein